MIVSSLALHHLITDEDNPAELLEQIKWLEGMGFASIDVIWKYYNYAVYGGRK